MDNSFVHQFGCNDYASCLSDLEGFLSLQDISKYTTPYLLSQKEQFSFKVIVHDGVCQQIISNIQVDLNAILFAEGGGYASGGHPILNTKLTVGTYSYEIFLDGAFGVILKNKEEIPLAVMGFSVNNNQIFVTQLQGVMLESAHKPRHIHRSINRILWKDCFISVIKDIAQSFGKKEIIFQSANNSYWDPIRDNSRGVEIYDRFFMQKGFSQREDGNFFIQL